MVIGNSDLDSLKKLYYKEVNKLKDTLSEEEKVGANKAHEVFDDIIRSYKMILASLTK